DDQQIRYDKYFSSQPQYQNDIRFLCSFLKKELEDIYNASMSLFQYENNLHIYFRTVDGKQYCYIDLGNEIVLLSDQNEELRRFSREHINRK
ncbi:MAG: hypothetical protein LBR40_04820, partial [Bacilli bacterium]|nr:hypothetical protein [Bacilli bacterium]